MSIGPVDPESIRIGKKKWLWAKPWQDLGDPAALIEQLLALIRNQDFWDCAGGQMRFDLGRQMMDIDDGRFDTGYGQPVERMVDQRLARDRNQRLWQLIGQGPHSRAQSGGEDHGFDWQERGHQGRLLPS